MSGKKYLQPCAEKIIIGILIALTGINAILAASIEQPGPFIATISYAIITYLCWGKNHFQAGFIGGICGLGIHVYELIFQDLGLLRGIDLGLFYANIVLPIPLMYFSHMAQRELNRGDIET